MKEETEMVDLFLNVMMYQEIHRIDFMRKIKLAITTFCAIKSHTVTNQIIVGIVNLK